MAVFEELMAHLSKAADQDDKLLKVHTVILVCVQVLEDTFNRRFVIGFLQVREV